MNNNFNNNREYRLKTFKEKVYNSTIKIVNNSNSNETKQENIQNSNNQINIINKDQEKPIKCPHCHSEDFIKYGTYNKNQRYKCKSRKCERTFSEATQNPFKHSKKFKENCHKYEALYEEGLTIRECAKALNITIVTSFFWRHRFLYNLKRVNYVEKLCNYAELTRVVIIENFKGDRNSINKKKDKISIVNGMNKSIDIISIIAARNHLGIYELRDNIAPRIDKKACAIGFLDGRIQAFSDKHNEVNKIKINKINIKPIDKSYSLKVKRWLKKFRGVATKYIDHYLSWRAYEYKKNFEYDYGLNEEEKNKLQINLKIKITTYISWNCIKEKVLNV